MASNNCRFFMKGSCRSGANCRFSHSAHEGRNTTTPMARNSNRTSFFNSNPPTGLVNKSVRRGSVNAFEHVFCLDTYKAPDPNYSINDLTNYIQTAQCQIRDEYDQVFKQIIDEKLALYAQNDKRALDKLAEMKLVLNTQEQLAFQQLESLNKQLDHYSKIEINNYNLNKLKNAYEREFKRASNRLPFYAFRSKILEALDQHNVIIIVGETGSGKTTQVPQYLLEANLAGNKKIVCTQPRKLAAASVCKRISEELDCTDSNLIHCKVTKFNRNDIKFEQIKLEFLTDQFLLAEFKKDNELKHYNIIIVDEAHERTFYTDILLSQLKHLVHKRKNTPSPLKLIVMSATINEQKFSVYFNNCPILKIPGRTYPVTVKYEPLQDDYVQHSVDKVQQFINQSKMEKNSDILIFLPAIDDINKAVYLTKQYMNERRLNEKFIVMKLHGRMDLNDQSEILKDNQLKTKIIYSTNIAETSVTINTVSIIIDSGRVKERQFDQDRNVSILKLKLISQSSANQRKGRAGRCSSGVCYRLYSQIDYESMEPVIQPEIFKTHLGIVILQLLSCNISDVNDCDLIDKPDKYSVMKSFEKLQMLQLVESNQITAKGLIAAALYLEPSISRIIIEGLYSGITQSMIKIAAMMTVSNCLYDRTQKNEADLSKLMHSDKHGDFVSMLTIYNSFEAIKDTSEQKEFCVSNKYVFKSLILARQTYKELFFLLKSYLAQTKNTLINNLTDEHQILNKNLIIQSICSGFHENLAYYNGKINNKNVYKLFSLNQEAFIHNDSVLSVLADNDYDHKFLLFGDLVRTDKLYMRNLTPIKLDTLSRFTTKEFSQASNLLKEKLAKKVSPRIIDIFKENNHELIESLEEKIGSIIDIKNDQIELFTTSNLMSEHNLILEEYIALAKQRITKELFEFKPIEQNNVRVLFKSSLQVHTVLLSGEYVKLLIFDLSTNVSELSLRNLFLKFGTIHDFKLNKSYSSKLNGYVIFVTYKNAKRAFETLNGYILNGIALNLKPSLSLEENIYPKNTKLKVVWFLTRPTGKAIVTLNQNSTSTEVYSSLSSRGYKCETSKLNNKQLIISNCTRNSNILDEIDFIEEQNDLGAIEDCFFCREEHKLDLLSEQTYLQSIIIKSFFEKYGQIETIDILPYGLTKNNKIKAQTTVYIGYSSMESIDKAFNSLNGQIIPSELFGYGKLHLSTNFIHEYKIPNKALQIIDIKRLESDIKLKFRCKLFQTDRRDKYDNSLITIKAFTQDLLTEAVRFTDLMLNPVTLLLPYFKYDQLRKVLNKKNYQNDLEAKYRIHIHKDARFNRVNIYGGRLTSELVKSELNKQLNTETNAQVVEIPVSSFKALVGTTGEIYRDLCEQFRGEIHLNVRNKTIRFHSKESQIEAFKQRIKELELAYSIGAKRSLSGDSCTICTDYLENPFKFVLCEHSSCFLCLTTQFSSFDQSTELVCVQCSSMIAICDLKLLAQTNDELIKSKCSISFAKFMLNRSQHNYSYCSNCGLLYLRANGKEYCSDKCEKVNRDKLHDQLNMKYFEKNKLTIKRCPNCTLPVEKIQGCNHMTCLCNTHFCWSCRFIGRSADDVYNHQRTCTGK